MESDNKPLNFIVVGLVIFLVIMLIISIAKPVKEMFSSNKLFNKESPSENIEYTDDIKNITLKLKNVDLNISSGETFQIKNVDSSITVDKSEDSLTIIDRRSSIVILKRKPINIVIPSELLLETFKLETGAGKVVLDGINAEKLEVSFGAGKAVLKNIVSNNSEIQAGAGSLIVEDSKLNDLTLELGVGSVSIDSDITGNSQILAGVGEVELNLPKDINNYKFEFEKGSGNIILNGESILENSYGDNSDNLIRVEGGLGEIKINTLSEE